MKTERTLSQDSLDALLTWLDPLRERAGEKYENIRRKLIKIFASRGCAHAEELADETIDRVARRTPEIAATYTGEPALYFYGVANNVHLEYLKKKPAPAPSPSLPAIKVEEIEREYECLDRCMERLAASARELILRYYREEKQAKIDYRRELAAEIGIAPGALRIRAHRIRATLQECVAECLRLAGAS